MMIHPFNVQSMNQRNKELLEDKKRLLIQNKVEFERLEKEKVSLTRNTIKLVA